MGKEVMEDFDIEKWHNNIAANPVIKKRVHEPMIQLAGLSKNDFKIVMDLGCGSGELMKNSAETSPNSFYIGVDMSREVLGFAKKNLSSFTVAGPLKMNRGNPKADILLEKGNKIMMYPHIQRKDAFLLEGDFLFDNKFIDFADVVFILFPQFVLPKAFVMKAKKIPGKPVYAMFKKMESLQMTLATFQALKMLKPGGKLIACLYTPVPRNQIVKNHQSINKFPFAKAGKRKITKGKDIGEIILKGRYSKILESVLDSLSLVIQTYIKTSNDELFDEINTWGATLDLINKGKMTLDAKSGKIILHIGKDRIPL